MKEQKEDWERKSGEFEVELGQVNADLTAEKAERKSEKEAADQNIAVLKIIFQVWNSRKLRWNQIMKNSLKK